MKNLLSTTALIAGLAFGSAALAQDAAQVPLTNAAGDILYSWKIGTGPVQQGTLAEYNTAVSGIVDPAERPAAAIMLVDAADDVAPYQPSSLLDNILADATELSASLSNISQNLNDINGSIQIDTSRDFVDMAAVVDTLTNKGTIPFGSFSQVNANVYAQDLPASLLEIVDPLTLTLGALSTTAIGTLQSGAMTGTFDATGLVQKVSANAKSSTTGTDLLAETYGGFADTLAMQNISVNSGAIDGSIALKMADVNATVGAVATTAIGSLQSGDLTATVDGAMGAVTSTTAGLVTALVGTPTP